MFERCEGGDLGEEEEAAVVSPCRVGTLSKATDCWSTGNTSMPQSVSRYSKPDGVHSWFQRMVVGTQNQMGLPFAPRLCSYPPHFGSRTATPPRAPAGTSNEMSPANSTTKPTWWVPRTAYTPSHATTSNSLHASAPAHRRPPSATKRRPDPYCEGPGFIFLFLSKNSFKPRQTLRC